METIKVVVETTANSRAKYKFDKENNCYTVKKLLPEGMVFPFDFGFIPETKGEDGDPIDAMVIAEFSGFPGCHIECRLIGAIKAEQTEKKERIRNDRFFFIPTASLVYSHVNNLSELNREFKDQLKNFFINYNKAEGKIFRPIANLDSVKALIELKKFRTS